MKRTSKQYDADVLLGTDNLALTDDLSLTAFAGIQYVEAESTYIRGDDFIVPGLITYANTKRKSGSYGFSKENKLCIRIC